MIFNKNEEGRYSNGCGRCCMMCNETSEHEDKFGRDKPCHCTICENKDDFDCNNCAHECNDN